MRLIDTTPAMVSFVLPLDSLGLGLRLGDKVKVSGGWGAAMYHVTHLSVGHKEVKIDLTVAERIHWTEEE